MTHFLVKALADIRSNRFLNLVTIITISLSILVVSLVLLFFENAGRVMESWNQGGRAMIYLAPSFSKDQLPGVEAQLDALNAVDQMTFISKDQALETLRQDMADRSAFLKTLKENPLPDAIEIRLKAYKSLEDIQAVVEKIEKIDLVSDVEYGQGWLGKFLKIFKLFKFTGYAMCSLFFLIALFITSNTVRLAFYSRKLEVEIMRLVGATETFIKAPFYVEGVMQGFLGGVLGLAILLGAYIMVSTGIARNFDAYVYFNIQFLSPKIIGLIILGSTFLGWFGCYLSLRQILK